MSSIKSLFGATEERGPTRKVTRARSYSVLRVGRVCWQVTLRALTLALPDRSNPCPSWTDISTQHMQFIRHTHTHTYTERTQRWH